MNLEQDYRTNLSEIFYAEARALLPDAPVLVFYNDDVHNALGLPEAWRARVDYASGAAYPPGAHPIAQAYAGHQFGYFTMLGDGRALLLGEWRDREGYLNDIQLKGSGPTVFARGGDGLATLGSVLREYLISAWMAAQGIATTRPLAAATTGLTVYRAYPRPAAVLTRVARSFIRVGTAQYAYAYGGASGFESLMSYARRRLSGKADPSSDSWMPWIEQVLRAQADTLADWMSIGFVHGVLNTDNILLSGETMDYGPCAFMEKYDPMTSFSSIDRGKRYAYGRQPEMMFWNMAQWLRLFSHGIEAFEKTDTSWIEELLLKMRRQYEQRYMEKMTAKIGLLKNTAQDQTLVAELLEWMGKYNRDYTNTFVALMQNMGAGSGHEAPEVQAWLTQWRARLEAQGREKSEVMAVMRQNNPLFIPRNARIENIIVKAERYGSFSEAKRFMKQLERLHEEGYCPPDRDTEPMSDAVAAVYRTYCGT